MEADGFVGEEGNPERQHNLLHGHLVKMGNMVKVVKMVNMVKIVKIVIQ